MRGPIQGLRAPLRFALTPGYYMSRFQRLTRNARPYPGVARPLRLGAYPWLLHVAPLALYLETTLWTFATPFLIHESKK